MPPTQSREDTIFASIVVDRFRRANSNRTERENEWRRARRRWEPGYIDKLRVKRPPYVKTNYLYDSVKRKTQNLREASVANGRMVWAHCAQDKSGMTGEVVTSALDRILNWQGASRRTNNRISLARTAQGGILYGNAGHVLQYFDNGGDEWGVKFVNVDQFDLFPDWKHERWYIIRRYVTIAELRQMAETLSQPDPIPIGIQEVPTGEIDPMTGEPVMRVEPVFDDRPRDGGRAMRVYRKVLKEAKLGVTNTSEGLNMVATDRIQKSVDVGRTIDTGQRELEDTRDVMNSRIQILEYHETEGQRRFATIIPAIGGSDDMILQQQDNPYGVCLFIPFIPNFVDNEFWGLGESEILGHTAEAMDLTFRTLFRAHHRVGDPAMKYRRGSRIKQQFLRSPTGAAIDVQNMDDLQYMEIPSVAGGYQFLLDSTRQIADMATGESEQRRGAVTDPGSATNAQIAATAGTTRDKAILEEWATFIEMTAKAVLAILRVHLTEERAFQLLGEDGLQLFRLKPEYLDNDFLVQFAGNKSTMPVGAQVQAAYNFIAAAPDIANRPVVLRDISRKLGNANPSEWIAVPNPGLPMDPEDEWTVIREGGSVSIHPQDNHQQHILKHQEDGQMYLREDFARANDPSTKILNAHIGEHMAALDAQRQQMQAQAQEQMSLPGIEPGSGRQQVANNGAAGGSPGPTAAGQRGRF